RFKRNRNRSQNVAVIVDKRDRGHIKRLPHEQIPSFSRKGLCRTNLVQNVARGPFAVTKTCPEPTPHFLTIGRNAPANPLGPSKVFYTFKRFKQLSKSLNRLMI